MPYQFKTGRFGKYSTLGKDWVTLQEPLCRKCSLPLEAGRGFSECYWCNEGKTHIDGFNIKKISAASIYLPIEDLDEEIDEDVLPKESTPTSTILEYKDRPTVKRYRRMLFKLLEHALKNNYSELARGDSVMVPPPRGTSGRENHMEKLVNDLADAFNKPWKSALRKKNDYPLQKKQESFEERLENVRGNMECTVNLEGEDILLVDDIFTSGATLNECGRALREKGAEGVQALVIGRAVDFRHLKTADLIEEVEEA